MVRKSDLLESSGAAELCRLAIRDSGASAVTPKPANGESSQNKLSNNLFRPEGAAVEAGRVVAAVFVRQLVQH